MNTVAKLHFRSPPDYHRHTGDQFLTRRLIWDPSVCVSGWGSIWARPCIKSEEEKCCVVVETSNGFESRKGVNKLVGLVRNAVWKVSKPSLRSQPNFAEALEKLERTLFSLSMHIGSWLGGIIIGTMIGANMVLDEVSRSGPRNVVITGSTRGLGKALAREFLLSGDRVVVTSRNPESVDLTIKELAENLKQVIFATGGTSKQHLRHAKVVGISCDVSNPEDVRKLANFAVTAIGPIDIWVNNAGTNKGFRPLLQFNDDDIQQIVSTNLVGSILCTREALQIMGGQTKGGHIFNMDGAGSGGSSTPLTAVYGSTKCGLRQLQSSLLKECRRSKVGVHTASPGMVLTDLLLSGSSVQNKQMFNIICELPETVARTLVPRMRVVKGSGKAINYLTPPRILLALVTAWLRRGRWFDDKGRALYAAEADRLRNWAESRTRFSFTDAMEMYTENTWVSVFSLSVVCAFIILSSTNSTMPGT
ncbi:Probable chlorophyll(ide) b reductase NYC1-chloroplastic [Striga hermonthica]|uniref:chlorophyll(ide) b reductase n=1 Tax=Striga hermonthica TaxID=68872 RepID=A0A9N7N515_STRHE|nr:Probable chlorophyll(ide) b reductase NYC1-chloroplastic [Striga hermonthica]